MFVNIDLRQEHNLVDRFVDVQPVLLSGRLLNEAANPRNNLAGPLAIFEDPSQRLASFLQVGG